MYYDEVWLEIAADGESGTEGTGTTGTETKETTPEPQPTQLAEIEIDGEKLTPEQIKEYKKGYLRQSDYTKKTQEIANQRKQFEQQAKDTKEAMEVYNFIKSNPELARQLADYTPQAPKVDTQQQDPRLTDIDVRLKSIEIDNQLNILKMQDKNLDEVKLLNFAIEKNMDLQTAYYTLRGMDMDNIMKQRLAEQSASLTEQIKKNGGVVKTLIKETDSTSNSFNLSPEELNMAGKLNMSPEEYAKWKQ